ncbi:MAG: DedA family protein [Patescibacteria group bacterium]|nr:DedA family protein [Patescibacteria group bacterium]
MLMYRSRFDVLMALIDQFQAWGYSIILLISILESLAVVGLFVPGTTITVIFGLLASQGEFSVWILMVCAAVGAIIGDGISYWFGRQGKDFFKYENVIFKKAHLDYGEKFFKEHGAKSIFLGRFIGPLRPLIPLIAGLSNMKPKIFFLWNVLSCVLWSIAFVLIGYFFGHAWKLIGGVYGKLGAIVVVCLILAFVFLWRRKQIVKT